MPINYNTTLCSNPSRIFFVGSRFCARRHQNLTLPAAAHGADHAGFFHVFHQPGGGIDVFAPGLDQVLAAINEVQRAIGAAGAPEPYRLHPAGRDELAQPGDAHRDADDRRDTGAHAQGDEV